MSGVRLNFKLPFIGWMMQGAYRSLFYNAGSPPISPHLHCHGIHPPQSKIEGWDMKA
jgi:hypothetical protein